MSYRPAPYGGALELLPRYVQEELQRVSAELDLLRDVVRDLVAYRIIGGVSDRWLWDDTSTVMADPGAGYVRGDNSNLRNVTQLAFSTTDAFGRDLDALSPTASDLVGEFIFLELTGGNYVQGLVSAHVQNAGWSQITLTATAGSGNPAQDDPAEFVWYPSQTLVSPAGQIVGGAVDWRELVREVRGL